MSYIALDFCVFLLVLDSTLDPVMGAAQLRFDRRVLLQESPHGLYHTMDFVTVGQPLLAHSIEERLVIVIVKFVAAKTLSINPV